MQEKNMQEINELISKVKSRIEQYGIIPTQLGDNPAIPLGEFVTLIKKLDKLGLYKYNETYWCGLFWDFFYETKLGDLALGLYTRQPMDVTTGKPPYEGSVFGFSKFVSADWHPKERDQHDNGFALSAIPEVAKEIAKYGYCHFFRYSPLTFSELRTRMTFKQALAYYIRDIRQPYQVGAYALMGYGICDPISYLHLFFTILFMHIFKSKDTSYQKILKLFSDNARGLGRPLAWIFEGLQRLRHGKNWYRKLVTEYYSNNPIYPVVDMKCQKIDETNFMELGLIYKALEE